MCTIAGCLIRVMDCQFLKFFIILSAILLTIAYLYKSKTENAKDSSSDLVMDFENNEFTIGIGEYSSDVKFSAHITDSPQSGEFIKVLNQKIYLSNVNVTNYKNIVILIKNRCLVAVVFEPEERHFGEYNEIVENLSKEYDSNLFILMNAQVNVVGGINYRNCIVLGDVGFDLGLCVTNSGRKVLLQEIIAKFDDAPSAPDEEVVQEKIKYTRADDVVRIYNPEMSTLIEKNKASQTRSFISTLKHAFTKY